MSKTIIVTGASRGIGHEIVKIAEKKGHRVYSISRNIKALKDYSFKYPRQVDLANEDSIDKFSSEVKNDGVKVDALINNAGAFLNKPFEKISKKEFEYIFQVNVFGLSSITRKVLPIIDSKGHIVNISSVASEIGNGISPSYNASKAYQANYLQGLRFKAFRMKVPIFLTDVRPGFVDTEILMGNKDKLFWVAPLEKACKQIVNAIDRKKRVVYITKRWKIISLLIKTLPERIIRLFF